MCSTKQVLNKLVRARHGTRNSFALRLHGARHWSPTLSSEGLNDAVQYREGCCEHSRSPLQVHPIPSCRGSAFDPQIGCTEPADQGSCSSVPHSSGHGEERLARTVRRNNCGPASSSALQKSAFEKAFRCLVNQMAKNSGSWPLKSISSSTFLTTPGMHHPGGAVSRFSILEISHENDRKWA